MEAIEKHRGFPDHDQSDLSQSKRLVLDGKNKRSIDIHFDKIFTDDSVPLHSQGMPIDLLQID
jgi:hypothetical protein